MEHKKEEQSQSALDRLFSGVLQPAELERISKPAPAVRRDNGDELKDLPLDILQDFATGTDKQPFRSYAPEDLEALRQDVIAHGIIQPLVVRPIGAYRYEIISGHNRRTAAKEAGYTEVPCIIRQMSDDEAILQMCSTNLQQRKNLLPSEKAFAYRMQLEAMKRQAGRPCKNAESLNIELNELNSCQNGADLIGTRSDNLLAEEAGVSARMVQRYIRLTYLIPELLKAVDEKTLGLTIGATLSFLSLNNQAAVENLCFQQHSVYINQELADRLRQAEEDGEEFTEETLQRLVQPSGRNLRSVSLPPEDVQRYFPEGTSQTKIRQTIQAALQLYFERRVAD